MSDRLTTEDRARLRALAENATPGPWEDDVDELTDEATVHHDQEQRLWVADCGSKYHAPARADAAFIAASRQAVPALLDMLDQAEAERDHARAQVDRVRELHVKEPGVGTAYCIDCEQPLPCDTIRALDGEQ